MFLPSIRGTLSFWLSRLIQALGTSYVNELDSERALHNLKAWVQHNPKYSGLEIAVDEYSDGTLMDEVRYRTPDLHEVFMCDTPGYECCSIVTPPTVGKRWILMLTTNWSEVDFQGQMRTAMCICQQYACTIRGGVPPASQG